MSIIRHLEESLCEQAIMVELQEAVLQSYGDACTKKAERVDIDECVCAVRWQGKLPNTKSGLAGCD